MKTRKNINHSYIFLSYKINNGYLSQFHPISNVVKLITCLNIRNEPTIIAGHSPHDRTAMRFQAKIPLYHSPLDDGKGPPQCYLIINIDSQKGTATIALNMIPCYFKTNTNGLSYIPVILDGTDLKEPSEQNGKEYNKFAKTAARFHKILIFPEAVDILRTADRLKTILKHDYIHIQIDCSFKCTRSYVFAVPRVEIGHASIPLGLIVTPQKKPKHSLFSFKN